MGQRMPVCREQIARQMESVSAVTVTTRPIFGRLPQHVTPTEALASSLSIAKRPAWMFLHHPSIDLSNPFLPQMIVDSRG